METNYMIIEKLKYLKNVYGLTHQQMAVLFDVSNATISNIMSGKRAVSTETLKKIVYLFGISADWFLGLKSSPFDLQVLEACELQISPQGSDTIHINVPPEYETPTRRQQFYSNEIRSNIIFCCNVLAYKDNEIMSSLAYSALIFLKVLIERSVKEPRYKF